MQGLENANEEKKKVVVVEKEDQKGSKERVMKGPKTKKERDKKGKKRSDIIVHRMFHNKTKKNKSSWGIMGQEGTKKGKESRYVVVIIKGVRVCAGHRYD